MALIKLNNRGVRNVSEFGSVGPGSMVFIKKLTSDGSDDDLSFVSIGSEEEFFGMYFEEMVADLDRNNKPIATTKTDNTNKSKNKLTPEQMYR